MIDREILRQNGAKVKESLEKRGDNPKIVDDFAQLDKVWRKLRLEFELLQAQKNKYSRAGKPTAKELTKIKALDKQLSAHKKKLTEVEDKLLQVHLAIPNLVAADVPVGPGESANTVIVKIGSPKLTAGQAHHEIMVKNDYLDIKTAAKYSGSRFRYLKNEAAWAHLRLMVEAVSFARRNGFKFIIPPVLTKSETLTNSGFFPFANEDVFRVERDDLFLTGTSEQTLVALASGKVWDVSELPVRLVGFSTCFRREAGSYGKDTEGMFRQHQFDKVEMVSITTPETSAQEHEFLVGLEEKFTKNLGLAYQKVLIGSGDLGPTAVKKIDLEVWFPSQQRYRETHSASNCTDFQARRFDIKFKDKDGQVRLAHSLNATLATERLLLAVIENNQRPDGKVNWPRNLR